MEALNQDNEEFSFTKLGALTLNVVRYLEGGEKQKEDAQRDAEQSGDTEQKREQERAYIEQRLRDLAAFENRFNPGYRSRRKRN